VIGRPARRPGVVAPDARPRPAQPSVSGPPRPPATSGADPARRRPACSDARVTTGRRRHYAGFYDRPPEGPLALVHGNCQAEALRVLLAGSPTFPQVTVRVPPAHELTAEDLPHLERLLARTRVLVSQPVRDGYRDLPLGTRDLAARLPAGAGVLVWPVIRYRGLHPFSAIVRHPSDMARTPPVVPYHDLRTLARAAGRAPRGRPPAAAFRTVAARSVAELARRERAGCDVAVSDLLGAAGADAVHTLNHPGNAVLIGLARRVQAALGAPPDAAEPGRALLGEVRAPVDTDVLAARGLDPGAAVPHWTVGGRRVADDRVRAAQLAWYADHPEWVEAGLRRYREDIATLGL
jgi:hypothetical protein